MGMTAIRRFPAPWSGALRRAEVGHTVSLRAFSFSSGTFWERQAGAGLRKMLTATNDRRAYIRRRSVEVAVRDGTIAHVTSHKYVSQVAYARSLWPRLLRTATRGPRNPLLTALHRR